MKTYEVFLGEGVVEEGVCSLWDVITIPSRGQLHRENTRRLAVGNSRGALLVQRQEIGQSRQTCTCVHLRGLTMRIFAFAVAHVPGETQKVADALRRAPLDGGEEDLEVLLLSVFDSISSSIRRVIPEMDVERKRALFDRCHNSTSSWTL